MTHKTFLLAMGLIAAFGFAACDDDPPDGDGDADGDIDGDADGDGDSDGDGDTDGDVDGDGDADGVVVTTTGGDVRGSRGEGYIEFLGIPYAEPPVGELRFRSPRRREPWTETLRANDGLVACPQEMLGLVAGREDCLVVNVHVPDPMPDSAPVLFWIHGGGFTIGQGIQTDGGTKGDRIAAAHGAIVVSVNYRLGALGYLAHPDLTAEDGSSSGNWGFLDQVAALEWVRDNIAAFGGDPDNVTIFGESAGGISVCLHLMSPNSAGLFHRAVSQSGLCDSALPTLAEAEATGEALSDGLGCEEAADTLACLRDATLQQMIEATVATAPDTGGIAMSQTLRPNIDGTVLPAGFGAMAGAGAINAVPTIIGWNSDEGTLFVMLAESGGVVFDATAYAETVADLAAEYGIEAAAIEAQYPLADYPDPGAAVAAMMGDEAIQCPSRRAAELLAPVVETHVYRFEYPDAPFQLPGDRELGAFHVAEVQYIFGHPAALGVMDFTGDDLTLYEAMSGIWTSYAADGNPDYGTVAWPVFELAGDQHLVLDRDIRVETGADRDNCLLWAP